MVIDATSKSDIEQENYSTLNYEQIKKILMKINPAIKEFNTYEDTLLVVKVEKNGRETIEKLVKQEELQNFKIIAAVSDDVNVFDQEKTIWGIFTRFDAERDIVFTEQKLLGISPIYKGVMGIDATWKEGYPKPLRMNEEIVKKVDEKWVKLFKS